MAQIPCIGCQLPFSESELWKVGEKIVCGQCKSLFSGTPVAMAGNSAPPPAADDAFPPPAAASETKPPAQGVPMFGQRNPAFASAPAAGAPAAAAVKAPKITVDKDYDKRFYSHSGTVGVMGPIFMIAAGLVGAGILGPIYGYLTAFNPFIYLNFLAAVGFGMAMGFAVSMAAKFGDTRSGTAAGLIGLATGSLGLYISWGFFFSASMNTPVFLPPGDLLEAFQKAAKEGMWEIAGVRPTGGGLYTIWALEAMIIVGLSTLIAWHAVSSSPFCERCSRWMDGPKELGRREAIVDGQRFKKTVENGDFNPFTMIGPFTNPNAFTKAELYSCDKCRGIHTLNVFSVVVTKNDDGENEEDEDQIIELLLINTEAADWLSLNLK